MKVLWLTNYPSPYRVEFFNELGRELDLTVVFENSISQQTHRNKDWFDTNYQSFQPIFLNLRKADLLALNKIIRIEKSCDFQFIILGDYTTQLSIQFAQYLKIKKKPYVISIDGAFIRKSSIIANIIKESVIKPALLCFSPSNSSDEYLIKYGADKKKIIRYPFTSLYEKDILHSVPDANLINHLQDELNIEGKLSILLVSQFVHRKGLDFVLNNADKLPKDIHYYFVGDNPTEEYLEIVKEKQLDNVHFLGFMKKEKLKKYYQACDLFLFPTRFDPWGLVVNEAMANGMPIISTDRSAAALHLVRNGENGFIYKSENIDEYITAILRYYNDPRLISQNGTNSLMQIQEYTIESMAKVICDTFRYMENRV